MSIPIIIIHSGYASYLIRVLLQAKTTNPKSEIILLGNQENQFLNFVRHEPIERYCTSAKAFEAHYAKKHRSSNSYEYELFCFQRWFVLLEFMEAHGIKQCVHLDSDVMLYADLSQEAKKFEDFWFTLSKRSMGHTSFLKIEGLQKFCQLLISSYTCESTFLEVEEMALHRDKAKSKQNVSIDTTGDISDMLLLHIFYRKYIDRVGLTSEIIDNSIYDVNINKSHGFEMQDGMKRIRWIQKQPFCRNLELDEDIKFNSLHFQGKSKQYMSEYFTGNKSQFFYYRVKGLFRRKLMKW
jgi:hypothetical protein